MGFIEVNSKILLFDDSSEAFLECRKMSPPQKVFDKFLREAQETIREKMIESGVPAEVQARTKRIYSVHLKVQ